MQSKFQILPNLNAGANQNYSFGRSLDPYTYDFSEQNVKSSNFQLSSSITLFNGFQAVNTIRQNQLNLKAAIQDVEKLKNDIALNISAAFLQILFNKELYSMALAQSEVTLQQKTKVQRLVEAGSLAKGSLLEIESQFATEELQIVNLSSQLESSYLNLKQMLDLDTLTVFEIQLPLISEPDEKKYIPSVNQVYSEAIKALPQILSADYLLEASRISLAVSRGRRSPRITLSGSYGSGYSDARMLTMYVPTITTIGYTASGEDVYGNSFIYNTEKYPFRDQIKDNASTNISFGLSIPIFNNWMVNAAVSNAKIAVLNAQYNYENTCKQLYKEINQAHNDALAALKKYNATKKALWSIEESFRFTNQQYDVGLVSSVDYNLAKAKFDKAKSDLLQAKYEFVFKTKILDFYRGEAIKL
jgi:outer membrane protein